MCPKTMDCYFRGFYVVFIEEKLLSRSHFFFGLPKLPITNNGVMYNIWNAYAKQLYPYV